MAVDLSSQPTTTIDTMASYLDASMLDNDNMYPTSPHDYPTPGSYAESSQSVEPEQHPKKKRKAWGQPVPEINPILPPRKRAKTAEEKEQRKNERILRNRRAADKSRQRQKAEVEALRDRQLETEAENAQLKNILAQYQNQYGQLPGCDFNPQISPSQLASSAPRLSISALSPQSMDEPIHHSDFSPSDETPTFSATTPSTPFFKDSPALAPDLNLGHGAMYPSPINATGMTQYPAETSIITASQPTLRGLDLDPLSIDASDLFGENFAVPSVPAFDGNPFGEFVPIGVSHTDQLSFDSYFDYNAFDGETDGGISFETSEQTACLQSQLSASLGESSRPDFAAAV